MDPVDEAVRRNDEAIKREMNRFRGKLAGFVEACNLPPKQERGIISTMKQLSYDAEKAIKEEVGG